MQQGGHDIPLEVIERRIFLMPIKTKVHEWVLYDAISQYQQIIAYQEAKSPTILLNNKWIELEEKYD